MNIIIQALTLFAVFYTIYFCCKKRFVMAYMIFIVLVIALYSLSEFTQIEIDYNLPEYDNGRIIST